MRNIDFQTVLDNFGFYNIYGKHRGAYMRFLSVFFFPGTLIRLLMIYTYLSLKGWKFTMSYTPSLNVADNSLFSEGNRRGFYMMVTPGKRALVLKDMILLTFICYIPILMGILLYNYRLPVTGFLAYIFDRDLHIGFISLSASTVVKLLYYYAILCCLIGGAPIPES